MHRLITGCVAVVAALSVASVCASWRSAADPPTSCDPLSGVCTVTVDPPAASAPPTPGSAGSSGGSSTGCVGTDGKDYPCYDPQLGYWSGHCYWHYMSPQPAYQSGLWAGHVAGDGAIYTYTCPPFGPGAAGGEGMQWEATAPGAPTVTPAQLAQRALKTLTLPHPTVGMSPDGRLSNGDRYTVVRVPTWFWTSPASYQPLSAKASAAGAWAQVTVTPVQLRFTPGDGGKVVTCAGPGRAWVPGHDRPWATAPGGCDYSYPHSTFGSVDGKVTATYAITWSVSWTGSGSTGGELPALTTTTSSTFAVAEAQSVVTR